tara:strand:- start:354 stop:1004 length:651 start_codon:yes stop_codon:yes gene_type:complete
MINNIENIENNISTVITNDYFAHIMIIFIIIYHSSVGFKLPEFMIKFINNPLFNSIFTFVVLVLIAFIFAFDKKHLDKSIIIGLIFLITINLINGDIFTTHNLFNKNSESNINEIDSELDEVNKLLATIENKDNILLEENNIQNVENNVQNVENNVQDVENNVQNVENNVQNVENNVENVENVENNVQNLENDNLSTITQQQLDNIQGENFINYCK